MKQRFSSLDVKVIAHELSKTLCPLRVTNIYDLSSRIFLFKFHKPEHREQLIVDSGFRCHLTSYARSTAAAPSPFVTRLRKYLKTRRVTSISQVGTDRIIEFQFSDGLYKLYLEFYAGGNIVLTDADLNILALLRNVEEGAEHEKLRVGLQYNLSLRQNYAGVPSLTKERVREGLKKAVERQQEPSATGKKAKKQSNKDLLRKALAVSITELPPLLVDHALCAMEFDATLKPEQVLKDDALLDKLLSALQEARKVSEDITSQDSTKGYILAKQNPAAKSQSKDAAGDDAGTEKDSGLLYDDFHPFRPKQFETTDYTFLEFNGFNKTVDEFFSSIEGQKLESRLQERELLAKRKLEKARKEHENRLGGLQQEQTSNVRKAEAILANVDRVQEAAAAVNGLIAQSMDWGEIAQLIEREQSQRNPVAQMIKMPLKLHENTVTLLLDEPNAEEEEDDEGYETSSVSEDSEEEDAPSRKKEVVKPVQRPVNPKLAIDIDLALTPWANASQYFDQKKSAAVKEEKTLQASSKALKSHEKKVTADLKKGLKQEKDVLRPVRRQHWFEKFVYFISSDGYLVLGAKDAQQTEILYRRYLRKGDVYVHADLKGASSVIIKNNPETPNAPIPPSTLSQAGNLSVSMSDAWDSKAVMSAWWANSDQVSKIGSTGEFLPVGILEIKGKKNFLPPAQLLLGFAVMFEISEESKANHQKHRLVAPTTSADGNSADTTAPVPDSERATAAENTEDSDSDEDFPDARMESASEESGDEEETAPPSNPLQSSANAARDVEEDSGSEDETKEANGEEAPESLEDMPEELNPSSNDTAGEETSSIADSESTQTKTGKRHLSARERRLLRKGKDLDPTPASSEPPSVAGEEGDDDHSEAEEKEPEAKASGASSPRSSKPSVKAATKGKRGKAKRLAAKYAAQDEEERALAMRLLGSKVGQEAAAAKVDEKKAKEEQALADKQRRREQHLRAQAIGRAAEEARRAAHEGAAQDGEDVDDEALKSELIALDSFTGRPLPGDELLSAIPVCAPWSALATYKYKVKLQPGSVKKGKAVKEILSAWDNAGKDPKIVDKNNADVDRIWPKEIDLIKGWKEAEIFGVVPVGKVRVMMSGGRAGGGGTKGKKSARGGRGSKKK